MMTRFVLTLLAGLVVSLGTLVSGGSVLAKNWNTGSGDDITGSIWRVYQDDGDVQTIHFNRDKTVAYLNLVSKTGNEGKTFDDAHDKWSITNDFVKIFFSHGYSTMSLRLNKLQNSLTGTIKLNSGKRQKIQGYPEKKNVKFENGQFYNVDKPAKETIDKQIAKLKNAIKPIVLDTKYLANWNDYEICSAAIMNGYWTEAIEWAEHVKEAKRRGLTCGVVEGTEGVIISDKDRDKKALELFGNLASGSASFDDTLAGIFAFAESERKINQPNDPNEEKLEAERLRRIELERKLTALEAEKARQKQTILIDTKLPKITIAFASSNGPQGTIRGRASDNNGIAEVRVDGQLVQTDANGNFSANTYVPEGGVSVSIQAIDLAGLASSMSVRLDRAAVQTAAFRFDRLNPLGRKVAKSKDAVAIIVGVSDYKETTARAAYADSDATVFKDYAIEKLGVPSDRIKTLVNDGADEKDMLLAVKRWLARASKRDKTDVYIFFAGHGLASDNGEKMYLLPYDGSPELLDDTAILRDRLFSDIASANPRSVTVFLDTCYSGTTRGTDMLISSRPIAIKALQQSVPGNFTVMTAARGDQTAKPLEEAKHGMFSYFLMKGMEGEADKNQDNKITAGELHEYVQQNVVQQSSGSQTPELQGDAERVLVRFQ